MDFDKICESRFSARNFSDIRVSEKKIRQIIELIRLAPTALNHQPYKIIVANSDKAIEKLNRAKATLYNAKSVLIICSDRDNTWANRYSGENGILLDIGIITATALYAAAEHGLDSCCVWAIKPKTANRPNDIQSVGRRKNLPNGYKFGNNTRPE